MIVDRACSEVWKNFGSVFDDDGKKLDFVACKNWQGPGRTRLTPVLPAKQVRRWIES